MLILHFFTPHFTLFFTIPTQKTPYLSRFLVLFSDWVTVFHASNEKNNFLFFRSPQKTGNGVSTGFSGRWEVRIGAKRLSKWPK